MQDNVDNENYALYLHYSSISRIFIFFGVKKMLIFAPASKLLILYSFSDLHIINCGRNYCQEDYSPKLHVFDFKLFFSTFSYCCIFYCENIKLFLCNIFEDLL